MSTPRYGVWALKKTLYIYGIGLWEKIYILHSPFSILHSPFSILHSPFSILHSQFPILHEAVFKVVRLFLFLLHDLC
ncbi:MAG: hypothetical protein F6K41_10550 [Symploca sp. SIO3E6]|nr:hypothetical protein [Caldora sp. SIO3E6]